MDKEGYEFVADNLSGFSAEEEICSHYGLADPDTSGLPPVLKVNNTYSAYIPTKTGNIEFKLIVRDISRSETEHKYSYRVSVVKVTGSHRKL